MEADTSPLRATCPARPVEESVALWMGMAMAGGREVLGGFMYGCSAPAPPTTNRLCEVTPRGVCFEARVSKLVSQGDKYSKHFMCMRKTTLV